MSPPMRARALTRCAEGRDELDAVLADLQSLPEPDRAAVLMRAEDQMSYEEIAAALRISRRMRPRSKSTARG